MDMSGCHAPFKEPQLRLCVDEKTISHLLRLQQQKALKDSGPEGLAECPFCGFLAVYPAISVEKEFRCQHPACSTVSCRLCDEKKHAPISCKAAGKAKAAEKAVLHAQHTVEEALTDAVVRKCNKCSTRFIKEEGCNTVVCHTCGNKQWSVHTPHPRALSSPYQNH